MKMFSACMIVGAVLGGVALAVVGGSVAADGLAQNKANVPVEAGEGQRQPRSPVANQLPKPVLSSQDHVSQVTLQRLARLESQVAALTKQLAEVALARPSNSQVLAMPEEPLPKLSFAQVLESQELEQARVREELEQTFAQESPSLVLENRVGSTLTEMVAGLVETPYAGVQASDLLCKETMCKVKLTATNDEGASLLPHLIRQSLGRSGSVAAIDFHGDRSATATLVMN